MRAEKRKRLEAKGWKVGSVREFLDLSDQEAAYNVMYHVPPLEGRDCPVTRRRSPDGASIASGGKPPG
jgi:hypothetical protein